MVYDDVHCRWEMWLTSDSPATENDNQPIEFNNMVGLWHATSSNGANWSINYQFARDFTWDQAASGEHLGLLTGADIAIKGTGRYMVYVGFDDQNDADPDRFFARPHDDGLPRRRDDAQRRDARRELVVVSRSASTCSKRSSPRSFHCW